MKTGCKHWIMSMFLSDAANAMSMGTYSETSLSIKWIIRIKLTQGKMMIAFTKWHIRKKEAKGG